MRLMGKMVLAAVLAVAVAGPASAGLFERFRPTLDYSPGSTLIAHGAVQIGSFTYLPAVNGKVKPYQVQNHALADIVWGNNIDAYFHDSLLKELRFIGFKVDRGPVLSGEIKELLNDDTGDHSTKLTVHYVLKDAQGAVLYESEKSVQTTESAVRSNIEALVRDPAFLKVVDPEGKTHQPLPPARIKTTDSLNAVTAVYTPSLAFVLGGGVTIGAFDYPPSAGGKLDADQIRNTAIGNMHLTAPVADYVKDALGSELRLAGVDLEATDRVLTGSVVEFSCSDLGLTADWTLRVHYTVKDRAGAVLFDGEKITKRTYAKEPSLAFLILHRQIETLLTDETFAKAIGSPVTDNKAMVEKPSNGFYFPGFPTDSGPSSALIAHGAVAVGAFTYVPANAEVKTDEVGSPSGSSGWEFDRPLGEAVHNRVLNELRFVGIDVKNNARTLTGEIQKYTVERGEPSDWVLAVRFVVKDKAGATLYDAIKTAANKTVRNGVDFGEMKAVIEALVSDPAFIKAIN